MLQLGNWDYISFNSLNTATNPAPSSRKTNPAPSSQKKPQSCVMKKKDLLPINEMGLWNSAKSLFFLSSTKV